MYVMSVDPRRVAATFSEERINESRRVRRRNKMPRNLMPLRWHRYQEEILDCEGYLSYSKRTSAQLRTSGRQKTQNEYSESRFEPNPRNFRPQFSPTSAAIRVSTIEHASATFALIGVSGGGPSPRAIKVEGPAALAVPAGSVVSAVARDLAVLAGDAARRVTVALAPAAHGKVRDRVVMGHGGGGRAQSADPAAATAADRHHDRAVGQRGGGRGRGDRHEAHVPDRGVDGVVGLHLVGCDHLVHRWQRRYQGILAVEDRVLLTLQALLAFPLALRELFEAGDLVMVMVILAYERYLIRIGWWRRWRLLRHVQTVEHHPDVGGGHPVLEYRRVVEVGSGGPALERAEGNSADRAKAVAARVTVAVGAPCLLFVRLGDGRAIRPAVHAATLRRVELKRLPGLAVVHGLVDRDGVRLGGTRAELQAHVRELVLLAEGEGEGDVVGWCREALRADERLAAPAGHVVRVVEVGQVAGGETSARCAVVAHVAVADAGVAAGLVGDVAVAGGPAGTARGRGFDARAECRVHEVGYATTRPILVVAWVAGVLLAGEHLGVDLAAGLLLLQQQQQQQQDRREDDPGAGGSARAPFRRHAAPRGEQRFLVP